MKALIMVDIQNDFTTGGALAVPRGEDIVPVVNAFQNKFDLVVATQDWHPQSHKSFASNHPGMKPFDQIKLNGLDQVLWPDHCIQGTEGAQFHPELEMNRVEAIFRKGVDPEVDSYSGFFDNGKKRTTGLAGYLRERMVEQVFVCGLAGDYCVYYTAKDSLAEGFPTLLIEDAIRSLNDVDFEKVKKIIRDLGGDVVNSSNLNS